MSIKIIVERHADGYVGYPIGLRGGVLGQGDTYQEALSNTRSAIQFHIETFGDEAFADEQEILEAYVEDYAATA
jgi:predicted RNase H-like HicB family nuclease